MDLSSFSLNDIIKSRVKSPTGENLGVIEDIILDMRRGLAEYLVLSCAELFGQGKRYFAIPLGMQLFNMKKKGEVILYADKTSLGNAFAVNFSKCPKLSFGLNDSSILELYHYLPQTDN